MQDLIFLLCCLAPPLPSFLITSACPVMYGPCQAVLTWPSQPKSEENLGLFCQGRIHHRRCLI